MSESVANQSGPQNPDHWADLESGRLTALVAIARAAGQHTLQYFGAGDLHVDAKSDDSPVTVADREAEQLVRREIEASFPNDTVQGEEFAEKPGGSSYRWVVDPIDGTKSFICGVPLYSTLLALEKEGQPIAGVIFIPALGELLVAATGQGCWHEQRTDSGVARPWQRAQVSRRESLSEAVFLSSQFDSFGKRGAGEAFDTLQRECRITRSWGDGYGYLLVATGRADVMVDPICNAWDVAAILPVIQEAGGKFTDWKGQPTVRGGDGVGTNGRLHAVVMQILGCG
ncbi:histidinol-phosphatase [Stieleria sp. TO1_6]|uniref:histidinol-phosphatase n=1 Tax=Stieleria tagensis TaxID=2956795 RepID=UPI00209B2DB3|nr:histidinol-phosphatase [Stieleria tagensis]MCO8120183.1 histidinol-phosphatase [Stieleria tagensis]